jgi:NitT/TauT family transport system substrate-binding protein
MKRSVAVLSLCVAAALSAALPNARAETNEIRLARQFSMGYLQFNVMEHHKLLEKYAAQQGLKDLKITWLTFNGPNAMNDALISGSVDIVAGGVPGLLTLWDRTKGTAQEVRGISALSSQPFLMNTRKAEIKAITDLTDKDRVAVPAVKVSVQAVVLQMAAAKQFGEKDYGKLDSLTVSMSPPDATIALMGGASEVTCVFSVPPYQYQQLQKDGIHTVLNSSDVLGGPHSFTVAWTSKKFHDGNPKLYAALVSALKEATETVSKDPRGAAAFWIKDVNSKMPLDFAAGIVGGKQVKWTMAPQSTMKFAAFMHRVGTLKNEPQAWRDLFFPEVHDLSGD